MICCYRCYLTHSVVELTQQIQHTTDGQQIKMSVKVTSSRHTTFQTEHKLMSLSSQLNIVNTSIQVTSGAVLRWGVTPIWHEILTYWKLGIQAHKECSVALKIRQNVFPDGGSTLDSAGGGHDAPPDTSRLGRGHLPHTPSIWWGHYPQIFISLKPPLSHFTCQLKFTLQWHADIKAMVQLFLPSNWVHNYWNFLFSIAVL